MKERIVVLLTSLGATEQEVFSSLLKLGIRGVRRECASCPIAEHLKRNGIVIGSGALEGVTVSFLGAEISVGKYNYPMPEYPILRPVRDFIYSFDVGRFPELEVP